jgi:hypothetical protein
VCFQQVSGKGEGHHLVAQAPEEEFEAIERVEAELEE